MIFQIPVVSIRTNMHQKLDRVMAKDKKTRNLGATGLFIKVGR